MPETEVCTRLIVNAGSGSAARAGGTGPSASVAATRLAVRHVGGMRLKGEPVARILEDYPYLGEEDVEFAALFTEANPPLGRSKAADAAA